LHKRRDGNGLKTLICRIILYFPRDKIYFHLLSVTDPIDGLFAFQDRQTHVEGIAIEYSGKAVGKKNIGCQVYTFHKREDILYYFEQLAKLFPFRPS